jgi:hypothetical protein
MQLNQKMNKNSLLILCVGLVLAFASCSPETENLTVNSPELRLSAEGPLFEGANTATAAWEFNLAELTGRSGDGQPNVRKARLTHVEIVLEEGDDLPGIENMVFEMTSKNTPMTRLGLYKGRIEPGNPVELNVASQQENLSSAFEEGRITFVGDFDLLEEEYWENIHFSMKATFELEIKK